MRVLRVKVDGVGAFQVPFTIDIPRGRDPKRADIVLITGPNGSGKSTLLYSIAACFGAVEEYLHRVRPDGFAAVEIETSAGELDVLGIAQRQVPEVEVTDPFGQRREMKVILQSGDWNLFASGSTLQTLWGDLQRPSLEGTDRGVSLVFAYGAHRSVSKPQQLVISDPDDDGMKTAASLGRPTDSTAIAKWIANTVTKRAIARDEGDMVAVDGYTRVLAQFETAISSMTGEPFSVRVNREPLRVEALIGERSIELFLLPDGLKSALGWIGDLLMRLDRLPKPDSVHGTELPFVLLLDEPDLHLHPEWQRRMLLMVEMLFPNAQIFMTTHSPFIVGSATDASIITLGRHGEEAIVVESQIGESVQVILHDILRVSSEYDIETQQQIAKFDSLKAAVLRSEAEYQQLTELATEIAARSESLDNALRLQLDRVRSSLGGR